MRFTPRPTLVATAALLACGAAAVRAQTAPAPAPAASAPTQTLAPVSVTASADASARGLSPAFPGGQVARGGRAGILGTRDNLETPFSITSYTNDFIQDRQAKSVGEVLQADSGVRVARGFGNFQESYFLRGFLLGSDSIAYNGLYSLLPRQYIATELFERVEVLRGASTFLSGATPGSDGVGGTINLLPKRAGNVPLTRVTLGYASDATAIVSTDVARRFGPDGSVGVRVNAAYRTGETAVDDERAKLGLAAVGLDWRSRDVRVSADLGWQDNRLKRTRPNVGLGSATFVPRPPEGSTNFAQPWTYSNERDLFGTARAEWDLNANVTAFAAYGIRRSREGNSLANPDVTDAGTGAASHYRFDNTRRDRIGTGELGVRGAFATGPVEHRWVVSGGSFDGERDNAYAFDFGNPFATNLYTPSFTAQPAFSATAGFGGDLSDPRLTGKTKLTSVAVGDTLSVLDGTLLVTLGARRQTFEITDYAYGTAVQTGPGYDRSRTSPMAAAVVRVTKSLSVYGNYVEGLSQGETAPTFVFSGTPPVNAGQQLAPYVSRQKEIGVKGEWGDLGGSLALFSTTRPRAFVDATNTFVLGGEDRHRGAELSVFGRLAPSLRLLGGATWLDAEQQRTGSAATDGKRVIGVPRTVANLGLDWSVPGLEALSLDARGVHTGARYADAANTLRVPGWTRFDVGASYGFDVAGTAVTLRGQVENVFDRSYWASVGGYPGSGYLVVGAPRTFKLSASVDF
jgi:iron complex outermembrane receptor protein